MNWRKEERTDGKTSSLPAVCRTDPDYSGDGLVWRFLDMEISRREEPWQWAEQSRRYRRKEWCTVLKKPPHSYLSEKSNSDPFRIDKNYPFEISNVQVKEEKLTV